MHWIPLDRCHGFFKLVNFTSFSTEPFRFTGCPRRLSGSGSNRQHNDAMDALASRQPVGSRLFQDLGRLSDGPLHEIFLGPIGTFAIAARRMDNDSQSIKQVLFMSK